MTASSSTSMSPSVRSGTAREDGGVVMEAVESLRFTSSSFPWTDFTLIWSGWIFSWDFIWSSSAFFSFSSNTWVSWAMEPRRFPIFRFFTHLRPVPGRTSPWRFDFPENWKGVIKCVFGIFVNLMRWV